MTEYLRGLGIGLINLLGVAVPGAILLGMAAVGLLFPFSCIALNLAGVYIPNVAHWSSFAIWTGIVSFLTISYVAGYILRLTSVNDLDQTSVNKMKQPSAVFAGDLCSATSEPNGEVRYEKITDRFPYITLKRFLYEKGYTNLVSSVPWGDDPSKPPSLNEQKQQIVQNYAACDNAHVNMWKNDIELYCPQLSAAVNSAEAHVRLMSGTWLAIRTNLWLVSIGTLAAVAAILPTFLHASGDWSLVLQRSAWYYAVQICLGAFMILSMLWAQRTIELLFHRRRVGELLLVLHAKKHADRLALEQFFAHFASLLEKKDR